MTELQASSDIGGTCDTKQVPSWRCSFPGSQGPDLKSRDQSFTHEHRLSLSISPTSTLRRKKTPAPNILYSPLSPPAPLHTPLTHLHTMPPKTKKVRETFNALGVTGGAPKFKQHVKSARKPTSWERKALKAAKTNEPVQSESNPNVVKAQPRAPDRQTKKTTRITKSDFQHPQRSLDLSSSSSSGSADDSSDDSSSNEEQIDLQPKSKGASAAVLLKPKRSKKERIVSITFEHFPVQERDFHGISVSAESALQCDLVSRLPATLFLSPQFYRVYCPTFWVDLSITLETLLIYASLSEIWLAPRLICVVALCDFRQVGSVQKVDEGSDALGILSCVNMHAHSKRPSIQAISSTLLRRCPKEKHSKVQSLISSPSTALVVSSRILNVFACVLIATMVLFYYLLRRCLMRSPSLYGRIFWRKFPLLKRLATFSAMRSDLA